MYSILVGDPQDFALETAIQRWLPSSSLLGLGYCVLHLNNRQYGVRRLAPSGLHNCYDSVMERLAMRGQHFAPFDPETDAKQIADAYLASGHWEERQGDTYFGLGSEAFVMAIEASGIRWATAGDEAHADGGYVLQFDVGELVRLVAFNGTDWQPVLGQDVSDLWLDANRYYSLLDEWIARFDQEYLQSEAS